MNSKKFLQRFLPLNQNLNLVLNHNQTQNHQNLHSLLEHFFSTTERLTGKITVACHPEKTIITMFYYIPDPSQSLNHNTINNLGELLSKTLNSQVELQLVKQHYPYLDSLILAKYISLNTQDYKFPQIIQKLFLHLAPVKSIIPNHSILPSHIVGIKVQISGQLMLDRAAPRQTVQTIQLGSFKKNNLALVDYAAYTDKNSKGAFTVKVWLSQKRV